MIKKEELRLGNIVDKGVIIELKLNCCRVEYFVGDIRRTSLISYEDLEPVIVTEKVLTKFGFKKVGKLFYKDNNYNNIFQFESCYISLDNYDNVFFDWVEGSIVGYEQLHLHELQNIFFDMTFKELTLAR